MTDNTIDVDAVLDAMIERRRINSINIMDAVFVRGGKVLEVTRAERDKWKFTGLGITDFLVTVDCRIQRREG